MLTPSQLKTIEWIRVNDPFLYQLAQKRFEIKREKGMAGLGEVVAPNKSFWNTLAETAQSVLPAVINMPAQKKVLDIQMKRAEQGLPPIDAAAYIPPIKFSADISEDTENALTRIAQESTKTGVAEILKKVAPYAVPAVLLMILLGRKKK